MKLKSVLENLDGLDDALKAFYTEKDGKFVLQVEGFDAGETEVLRRTMTRAKEEKKVAETKLAALEERFAGLPDDFSVDDYNATLDKGSGKVDQRLTEQKDRLTTQFNAKLAEKDAKLEQATKRADSLHSENALMTAMSEAGINLPSAQKAVKAIMSNQVKVEYEGDQAIVTIDNMPVADKLKAYAQTEEGKFFVSAPANGGGGAGGGGGKPPADYDKMSDTELMLIQDKDPRAKAAMDKRTTVPKQIR